MKLSANIGRFVLENRKQPGEEFLPLRKALRMKVLRGFPDRGLNDVRRSDFGPQGSAQALVRQLGQQRAIEREQLLQSACFLIAGAIETTRKLTQIRATTFRRRPK